MPEIAVRWIGNPCQNGSTHGAVGGAGQRCKTSAGVSHNRPSALPFYVTPRIVTVFGATQYCEGACPPVFSHSIIALCY